MSTTPGGDRPRFPRLLARGLGGGAPLAPPRVATHETRADADRAVEALQGSGPAPRRLAIIASDSWTEECALGAYGARARSCCGAGRASFVTIGKLKRGAIAEGLRSLDVPGPAALAHEAAVRAGKVLVVVLGAAEDDLLVRRSVRRSRQVAASRWRRRP